MNTMEIAKTIRLRPGLYVVAVSGGIDSMVLLHLLKEHERNNPKKFRFIVAHFDHGIRLESAKDRLFVGATASKLRLPFVYEKGELGSEASEAAARVARYAFLRKVRDQALADGIITAHHLDDVLETAILNIIRGTGRKGLSSLKTTDGIHRPLLHVPKSKLLDYAEQQKLTWREDSTNSDTKYRRNYVRHNIIKKIKNTSPQSYHKLTVLIRRQREINHAIDQHLETILHTQPSRQSLRRKDVIHLPYKVACELVAEWLRSNGKRQLSRWLVERLTMAIRTAQPGTVMLVDAKSQIGFTKAKAEFSNL
jgi:tRNA(Ile)-lysidine synthetase-like protein